MGGVLANLVAAAIAYVCGIGTREVWQRLRRLRARRRSDRTREQRHPRYTGDWLVRYYSDRGRADHLYEIRSAGVARRIAFLTKPSWDLSGRREADVLQQRIPQELANVARDKRVLARREHYLDGLEGGDAVWNDYIARVAAIEESASGPVLRAGVAEYFQFLSVCGALEDETYRAVSRNRATPLRDENLPSVDVAAECRLGAHALGMQVAFVFLTTDGYKLLIQRRSHAVSIYGGARAVVPVFGCQTKDLTEQTEIDLFHNFIREVFEELYGGEVERAGAHVDPTWFYRSPPIEGLLQHRSDGTLTFDLLGFGFDALNGEVDLCGLAVMQDMDYLDRELALFSRNWEMEKIEVVDLFGQQLRDEVLTGEFAPGAAYTIAKTWDALA